MVRKFLKNLSGGSEEVEGFEVILNEITDSPDKLFIWQFKDLHGDELEDIWEDELRDILEYDFQSHHVVLNGEVDIHEMLVEEGNVIRERDKVYRKVKEHE